MKARDMASVRLALDARPSKPNLNFSKRLRTRSVHRNFREETRLLAHPSIGDLSSIWTVRGIAEGARRTCCLGIPCITGTQPAKKTSQSTIIATYITIILLYFSKGLAFGSLGASFLYRLLVCHFMRSLSRDRYWRNRAAFRAKGNVSTAISQQPLGTAVKTQEKKL